MVLGPSERRVEPRPRPPTDEALILDDLPLAIQIFIQPDIPNCDLIVSLDISLTVVRTIAKPFLSSTQVNSLAPLHLIVPLSWLEPDLAPDLAPVAAAIELVSLPLHWRCTLTDPALLHLVQLLQTELDSPRPLHHLCIDSIGRVLTTHILRDWQAKSGQ